MKALVYETAHTLDNFAIGLQEVAEPTVREFDVLVEIHAIAINPGETFFRRRAVPSRAVASFSDGNLPELSLRPGPQSETSRLGIGFLVLETCREMVRGRSA